MNFDMEQIWNTYILPWGTNIALAILVFIIGRILVGVVMAGLVRMMKVGKLDQILINFMSTVCHSALILLVIIVSLSQLGVDTTSLVALLGAAGLAIGLALKDSLGHFAAGVMLILFRPFKVGDFVEVAGVAGSVSEITIFSTRLKTPDSKMVTVPNASVFGNTMINYSYELTRRVDMVVGISYGSDLLKAKRILEEILTNHEKVLKDPAYTVAVLELADSSVNLVVRPWVLSADYWAVRFELTETIKLKFDEHGIGIPFPQMDVHINQVAQ
ncbi:mechanosensitive ion channel family protein [Gynuella sunshinyii]|uniref:Small-conductance mechanosensitive channel n=1 Tax=Gynuella sunshinyii YC6258 TaxID=1445510 RepID=A0A0C5VPJ0_9GAMM|nr:mechanosensitive ion channel domain-containing protein [Gynuella sunshinyii]AJQ96567.1 small-conductance mechanosensitive channel [Gynuella sunshinyii YC6258]